MDIYYYIMDCVSDYLKSSGRKPKIYVGTITAEQLLGVIGIRHCFEEDGSEKMKIYGCDFEISNFEWGFYLE